MSGETVIRLSSHQVGKTAWLDKQRWMRHRLRFLARRSFPLVGAARR